MVSDNSIYRDIINNLSELIYNKMRQLESEQKHPGRCPDEMDDNLAKLDKQVKRLLAMRTEFEVLMTDIILK